MTPGTWIARPGSDVRHLLGLHHSGKWLLDADPDIVWLGACNQGRITAPADHSADPHVSEEVMRLYRPCKKCVMILKWRTDYYVEILNAAWNDIRAAEPKELVG